MKGVLLKDLYIARSNILVTVVSLVVLGFGLSFLLETSALLVLAPVASTTAVFISITSDAASKWNKHVITMPVSRGQIKGISETTYYLTVTPSPLQASGAAVAAPLAFLEGRKHFMTYLRHSITLGVVTPSCFC
mgnify:FL=1